MSEALELHESEPKRGTIAWLETLPTVLVDGVELPNVHRAHAGLIPDAGDGMCRALRTNGQRCRAVRTRRYGVCIVHAGGGDAELASKRGVEARARLKSRRVMLGIGPKTAANPRQIARMVAQERAEELAKALVDGPLDARDLNAVERQLAVIRALDATFPIQTATLEVELPANPDAVQGMGWQELQALAARMLEEG